MSQYTSTSILKDSSAHVFIELEQRILVHFYIIIGK